MNRKPVAEYPAQKANRPAPPDGRTRCRLRQKESEGSQPTCGSHEPPAERAPLKELKFAQGCNTSAVQPAVRVMVEKQMAPWSLRREAHRTGRASVNPSCNIAASPRMQKVSNDGGSEKERKGCFFFPSDEGSANEVRSKGHLLVLKVNGLAKMIRNGGSKKATRAAAGVTLPATECRILYPPSTNCPILQRGPEANSYLESARPKPGKPPVRNSDRFRAIAAKKPSASTPCGCLSAVGLFGRTARDVSKCQGKKPSSCIELASSPAPLLPTTPASLTVPSLKLSSNELVNGARNAHYSKHADELQVIPAQSTPDQQLPRASNASRRTSFEHSELPEKKVVWREGLLQRLGKLHGLGNCKLSLEELIELDDNACLPVNASSESLREASEFSAAAMEASSWKMEFQDGRPVLPLQKEDLSPDIHCMWAFCHTNKLFESSKRHDVNYED